MLFSVCLGVKGKLGVDGKRGLPGKDVRAFIIFGVH